MSFSKNKIIYPAVLLILTTSLVGILTANASVGGPVIPDCTEMVNPFLLPSDGGIYATGDTSAYVNSSLSESACKTTHAPYADAHISVVPNTHNATAAAITNKIHGPWTDHYHSFHNNSIQDDYIYKTYMAAFEITVESDGVNNTSTTLMACPIFTGQSGQIYNNFKKCVDDAYDPSHYGGIHLSRKTVENSIVLRWDFGWDTSSGKPWTSGENPSVDKDDAPEIFPYNTSTPFDVTFPFDPNEIRSFHMGIRLKSKDTISGDPQAWSGTTTSRALVKDAALLLANKSKYNLTCDKEGWCAIEPSDKKFYPSPPGTSGHPITSKGESNLNYYWVPIGTVSTVWKKQTQKQLAACESITLSPDVLNKSGPTNLKATVKFDDNNEYKTKVDWTVTNGSLNQTSDEQTDNTFDNTFTMSDPQKAASVTAKVTAVDEADLKGTKCEQGISIQTQQEGNFCNSLAILQNDKPFSGKQLYEDPISNLSVQVNASQGYAEQLKYNWTVSGGGTMSPPQTTSPAANTTLNGGTHGTQVTVQAVDPNDPNDPNANVTKCTDSFNLYANCEKLDVILSKDPIVEGDKLISIKASPTFIPNTFNKGGIIWNITGGSLIKKALSPAYCTVPPTPNKPVPVECQYDFIPGPAYSTLELEADPDPNGNCKFDIVVQPPKDAGPGGEVAIEDGSEEGGSTNVDNQGTDEGSAGE